MGGRGIPGEALVFRQDISQLQSPQSEHQSQNLLSQLDPATNLTDHDRPSMASEAEICTPSLLRILSESSQVRSSHLFLSFHFKLKNHAQFLVVVHFQALQPHPTRGSEFDYQVLEGGVEPLRGGA